MKKINLFSRLWSSGADSQSTDVSLDCRLTVGSPSFHRRSTMLKLVSVLVLILTIGIGQMWGANAPVNTVLWGENFAHFGTKTPSSAGTGSGTTIYDGASISYAQSSTNTKGYNENLAGGTAPELLLAKSSTTWTISGIKTGGATEMSLTFLSNKTTFTVTVSSSNLEVTGSEKSWTISLKSGKTDPGTFNLVIKNTGSQNARIDNVVLKVTTAGGGGTPTHTLSSNVSPSGTGSVDLSATTVAEGSTATATATPNSGYKFSSWSISGTGASLSSTSTNPTTVTMGTANATVTANFVSKGCTDHAGTNVTSGASTEDDYGPVCAYNNYSTRQILYTRTDLNLAAGKKGTIKSIYFEYAGGDAMAARTIKIYMANTALTALSTSNCVPYASFSLVYDGSFSCSSAGWCEITLDSPFEYNGIGNLVVLIDDNTGSWASSKTFKYHEASTTTKAQIYYNNDGTNKDPSTTNWSDFDDTNYRPNTKFCILEADMVASTVTLMDNGATLTEVSAGAGVTLPSRSGCEGYTFAGWTKSWVAAQDDWTTTAPVIIPAGSYTPTTNESLYPVYTKTEGSGGVSSTDTETGKTATPYVQNTGWTASAGGTYTSAGNFGDTSPSIKMSSDGNWIASPTYSDAITDISFWYKPQNATGSISIFVSTDGDSWTELTGEAVSFSGSSTADTKSVTVSAGNNYKAVKIVYNKTTSNVAIDDIAITHGGGSVTSYISVPNCCTALATINGSFSFTSVGTTGATANWGWTGATTGISKNILKVYKESDNSLVTTIDNISASATSQAITGLDPCTEYYVKLTTVSSGGGYCDGVADQTGASHVTFTTSSYTVTKTGVTNVTAASLSAIPATTCASGFGPITIEAASGYVLPATITVTGATGSWTQATGSLTISSVTGNVSITITPTAASCASFSFHTGTGEDATVKTTNTTTCFSQVNSSTTWKIDNYVIPADTKFFVGDRGFFYDDNLGSNNSRSAVKTWSQEMFFEYTKNYGDGYRPTVGQATGAIGTLYIWSDNNWNNLHVGFSPQGYVFKLGSTNLSMSGSTTLDADRYWETSVITLTSTDISGNYQTNLYTGSAGGVASNNTQSTAVNTMGVKTNAGDNWRGTAINDGTDANTRGFFRIDIGDGGTKNWHAHWVPTHRVIFHSNYPGGGGPADTYSVDVSVEETNNSIALASAPSAPTGYTFAGWYDAADGGNQITTARTISAGASANVELWAHWTANTISLTLNKNTEDAGSNNGSGSIDYDATSGTISTAPTRTGYSVEGYYTDAACTAANKVLDASGNVINSTVSGYTTSGKWTRATTPTTLYTKWTPNNYTVTWHVGDATSTSTVAYNTEFQDISVGKPSVNNNSLSTCESNYFVGWVTSGGIRTTDGGTVALYNSNKVNATDKITGDIDFYAMFATSSGGGGAAVNTVLWAEDFSGWGDGDVPSGDDITNSHTGTTVYGDATLTYACVNGGSDTKLYGGNNQLYAGGVKPELLVGKNTGTFTVSGIPNGGASEITVSYKQSNKSLTVTASGTGYSGSATNKPDAAATESFDVTVGSASTFTLTFAATQNENARLDDIEVKVKTGGTTYSNYRTNCAACANTVTVSYNAAPTGGTVAVTKGGTPIAENGTVKTCDGSVNLTVTITPASHYTVTGLTAQISSTDMSQSNVGNVYTVTIPQNQTGTLTLTPTFTPETPLTITLNTNNKGTFTPIGTIYSGESFTFPTVTPSDAECSSFLGWIEGTTWSGDGTETDPTAITGLANYHAAGSSSGTLTTTKTYTAVFGEKDTQVIPAYQKVTSAPSNWSGDYLIVRDDNSRAFDGSLSTLDAADNYIGVTISDGSITANSIVNASKWTIAKVGETSNYTIKSASGYYIGRTANSNGLNSSTSEAYTNTLSYSVDHVVITSSGGPTLQMNSGTRFRYYGTSQQVLQLYKYNPDAEVVSYTYTTNPACTPRYRVTISSATGGSPEADKTYEHADETITITANPAAGYSFTSWTITKTTGGDNVTSTLLTGDKPTTANTTFTMPAYDITIAATYTKKMVSTLEVKDGATVISTTTGPVSGTVNISTGANKTLDVVITPSDAYDHSWTATVSAGSTYASITNVTDDGFRVNGLAQGDATITVNAPNDGSAKSVTLTVQVRDIMPEEIILKRDGSNTPIETLIMYYDETNSKGQYVKVNVGYSPANPTNKAFTFSSALTGKVGSHSHAPASGYEVLVANSVTSDAVNCTFTSSADGSVTKVLAVTVLPILSDRFVDYVHGNATQTVSARLSDDRYSIIPDINTPSLSDASDANPTSEDCETSHYHLVGWLPQTTAEALWAAGTPITDATEGLVRAGESVEATGQTWCAIWAEEQ